MFVFSDHDSAGDYAKWGLEELHQGHGFGVSVYTTDTKWEQM